MSETVVMPQMGESIAEGTITKWCVEVGSIVERDQELFEISTDKVDAVIPSPCAGVLSRILVSVGETVPVDTAVALIDKVGSKEGKRTSNVSDSPVEEGSEVEGEGRRPASAESGPRVFLVHGHEELAREKTARFLERLGLDVIVLHEQPNRGETLIEKFVLHSQVDYAVVLLTADDHGGPKERNQQRLRARQNVIFELGYFLGSLGRGRVCVLYEEEVELPSNFAGVAYIPWDKAGAWRLELMRVFEAAGLKINIQEILR